MLTRSTLSIYVMELLPNELCCEIFSRLSLYDLEECSLVCRRWNGILQDGVFSELQYARYSRILQCDRAADTRLLQALNVSTLNAVGQNAIYCAALAGRTSDLRVILASTPPHKMQAVLAASVNPVGKTALSAAVARGHLDCARELLDAGSNPDAQDVEGMSTLHIAAALDDTEIMNTLLAAALMQTHMI